MKKTHRAVLIPGDGIGPEVTSAAVAVIDAAGVDIDWTIGHIGAKALEETGEVLPKDLLENIMATKAALKGPVTTPIGGGFQSANVQLRKVLQLYASIRPVKNVPGVPSCYQGVDLVVIRENTEGLYSGIEHEVVPGVVESLKIMTEFACRRIARFAFDYAKRHARKKITAVHKANIMKMSDGLFLRMAREVASLHPDIHYEEMIVDSACMQLVQRPHKFDLLLMENLYGDILSELCSGLVGGVAVVPGANIGDEIAVFEAVHGSAPDIAGQDKANPTGILLSAVMMLRHIGEAEAANRIEQAIFATIEKGEHVTSDLGGTAGTREMTSAIIDELKA